MCINYDSLVPADSEAAARRLAGATEEAAEAKAEAADADAAKLASANNQLNKLEAAVEEAEAEAKAIDVFLVYVDTLRNDDEESNNLRYKILFDLKRSGDWSQVKWVQNTTLTLYILQKLYILHLINWLQ